LMVQANEQGFKWGEGCPLYTNQPFKHHQPLQWFVSDRKSHAQYIIDTHELFTILRDPFDRFVSDITWHIEKRPDTLQAFGYTQHDLKRDIRPFVHDILDLIESLAIDDIEPIPHEFIPFKVRRMFQKKAIQKAGLRKFGYAHFIPQQFFCEHNGDEIISRYFSLNSLSELETYLKVRGIHFSAQKKSNRSGISIELNEAEVQRIRQVYAKDIRLFESKCSVRATVAT